MKPTDAVLPRTKQEAAFWSLWVAQGWAAGETQAVDIYQDDLGRLERDLERFHAGCPYPQCRR